MSSYRHAEAVMGTVVRFELRGPGATTSADRAVKEVARWLHWVDATFSTFKPQSAISRLDRGEVRPQDCHPQVGQILDLCHDLSIATDGYFDAWASGHLDPSGVVKGWSIEMASSMLNDRGWPDHAIDGGGDVRTRGQAGGGRDWQVAITHPFRHDAFCAVVGLAQGAVATSGTYERGFHVIDPHRGQAATALASVTVLGPELTLTDAYATAALAMGADAPRWLLSLHQHDAYVIDAAGNGWATPGFEDHLIKVPASQQPAG